MSEPVTKSLAEELVQKYLGTPQGLAEIGVVLLCSDAIEEALEAAARIAHEYAVKAARDITSFAPKEVFEDVLAETDAGKIELAIRALKSEPTTASSALRGGSALSAEKC